MINRKDIKKAYIFKLIKTMIISLFLLFLLSQSAFAQSDYMEFIDELEGNEIVEINLVGISAENEVKLYDYLNIVKVGEPFIFSKIKILFDSLWNSKLFSDIVIDADLTEDSKVILTIKFDELPKVNKIRIEGAELITSYKIKDSITNIEESKSLSNSDIQKDIKNIIDTYSINGIIDTVVRYRTEEQEDGTYDVVFIIEEGREVFVESIEIIGAEKVLPKKIKKAMEIKESTFKDIKRSFDRNLLEKDKFNIINFYRSKGYLDAKIKEITYEIKQVDEEKQIQGYYIKITVEEGEQYKLTGYEFEGNSVFTNEELAKEIENKKDEPINEESILMSKESIKYKYYEKGFLYANVTPDIQKDEDTNEAYVVFSIYEDQRAHIESIEIIGSDSETYIIDRLFDLEEGEIFSLSKLISTRENLLNTGYFKAEGTIWQLNQGSQPGLIKLVWLVEEERLRSVYFNAQFDLTGSIAVSADLQLVNFAGNGWDLSFKMELQGFREFTVSAGIGTKYLFRYTPVSFNANFSYSVQNRTLSSYEMNAMNLYVTPEGYLANTDAYGSGLGIDISGDGTLGYGDYMPIDINNDGVIDENDAVAPKDVNSDGEFTSAELSAPGLSYTEHDLSVSVSGGYEFFKGFESYLSIHSLFSAAQNPTFGETGIVASNNNLRKVAVSQEMIALIFGNDSTLTRRLQGGWIATLGFTLGINLSYLKIGALSSSGPLASGGWKASLSFSPYFFGKQFIKWRADFSTYFTLIGETDKPNLILAVRLGIEFLSPLGGSIIDHTKITASDKVGFDGATELRGFWTVDRNLLGYGKWIAQLELRGPFPGAGDFLWMVPFFLDWGNVGYDPHGGSTGLLSFTRTTIYDPVSGDEEVEFGRYTSGHKFSIGFGIRVINILPLQFYFAWPFEITTDGVFRVTDMRSGATNESPWWPEFVITGYIYF